MLVVILKIMQKKYVDEFLTLNQGICFYYFSLFGTKQTATKRPSW